MTRMILALCALMVAAPAVGQSAVEREILAAEQMLVRAIETADVAAYDKVTADDFTWVTPRGSVLTRAERLALLKRGAVPGFRSSGHNVRLFGDVAIVMGVNAQDTAKPMRYSRVWVRRNGEWRAVLTQATFVAETVK